MKYDDYTVEDFVLDKNFREWVESQNTESDEFWNRYMAKRPEKRSAIIEARSILNNMKFREHSLGTGQKNHMWNIIGKKTEGSVPRRMPIRYLNVDRYKRPQAGRPAWRRAAIAAVLLLSLFLSSWWLIPRDDNVRMVYRTDFGESKEFVLQDGSRVILNANSRVYVDHWEDDQDREVWLEGEAFFDVTHKQNKQPFVVHTPQIGARVLGTSFSVFSRNNRTVFELASGRLKLDNALTSTSIEMQPGDKVIYNEESSSPVREKINTNEVAAWKDNLLIFRRTTLGEIGSLLKSNYDIDLLFIDDAVSRYYFTGTVPSHDINTLLETLSKTFDLDIERHDKTVIIKTEM